MFVCVCACAYVVVSLWHKAQHIPTVSTNLHTRTHIQDSDVSKSPLKGRIGGFPDRAFTGSQETAVYRQKPNSAVNQATRQDTENHQLTLTAKDKTLPFVPSHLAGNISTDRVCHPS